MSIKIDIELQTKLNTTIRAHRKFGITIEAI